jgi:hypothetical protein
VRARAVMPWTWARVLRDHGPKSRDFGYAMLILRTFMDDSGFAYPSLRLWARGARMSVNTLRGHMETAVREGWLGIDRGDKRKHSYRCAIPAHIKLSDTDETLSDKLVSQLGDIDDVSEPNGPQSVSTQSDTDSNLNPQSVSAITDTDTDQCTLGSNKDAKNEVAGQNCVSANPNLCQPDQRSVSNETPICVSPVSAESRNSLTSLETQKEVLEVLRSSKEKFQREGAALTRSTRVGDGLNGKAKEPEATKERAERIRKAITTWTDWSDEQIAKVVKVSVEEVQIMKAGRA